MKLLLTSNGLSNQSIINSLLELVGKPFSETKIVFIPTAMNVEEGEKDWFITNLREIQELGAEFVDVVDISALPKEMWLPRIEYGDVLYFSGGNSAHLMRWIKESGLLEELPRLLKTKVWVGASAGGIVTGPSLAFSNEDKKLYYETAFGYEDKEGLGLVDFYFRPHLNNKYFPTVKKENLEKIAKNVDGVVYVLDDESALRVVGSVVEVISEGEHLVLNR